MTEETIWKRWFTAMDSNMASSDPVPAAVTYFFLFVLFGWIFFVLTWNFGFESTCNTAYSLVRSILRCLFCVTKCVLKKAWETVMDLFVSVTTKKKVTPATIVTTISVPIPTEVVTLTTMCGKVLSSIYISTSGERVWRGTPSEQVALMQVALTLLVAPKTRRP
jgi:hypothetical protein